MVYDTLEISVSRIMRGHHTLVERGVAFVEPDSFTSTMTVQQTILSFYPKSLAARGVERRLLTIQSPFAETSQTYQVCLS